MNGLTVISVFLLGMSNLSAQFIYSEEENKKMSATDPCSRYYYAKDETVKAFKACREAADKGDTGAQFKLGNLYALGDYKLKIKEDYASANKWFRKAAEGGNTEAQVKLGDVYYEGNGVGRSVKDALKWYLMAADKGNAVAQLDMGILYYRGEGVELDYKRALSWMLKSAENGNPEAQFNAGCMYLFSKGTDADFKAATKWYGKSAAQGYAMAQYYFAIMMTRGLGLPSADAKGAAVWYERAGRHGLPDAQYVLGRMYAEGEGVPQDWEKSFLWLLLAAWSVKNNPYSPVNTLVDMPRLKYDAAAEANAAAAHLTKEQIAGIRKQAEAMSSEIASRGVELDIEYSGNPLHKSSFKSDLEKLAEYKESLQ